VELRMNILSCQETRLVNIMSNGEVQVVFDDVIFRDASFYLGKFWMTR